MPPDRHEIAEHHERETEREHLGHIYLLLIVLEKGCSDYYPPDSVNCADSWIERQLRRFVTQHPSNNPPLNRYRTKGLREHEGDLAGWFRNLLLFFFLPAPRIGLDYNGHHPCDLHRFTVGFFEVFAALIYGLQRPHAHNAKSAPTSSIGAAAGGTVNAGAE